MKLYLITQTERRGYDTFDSAVVIAESLQEAKSVHPMTRSGLETDWTSDSWAHSPRKVKAKEIGLAKNHSKKGIVCSSFNAG